MRVILPHAHPSVTSPTMSSTTSYSNLLHISLLPQSILESLVILYTLMREVGGREDRRGSIRVAFWLKMLMAILWHRGASGGTVHPSGTVHGRIEERVPALGRRIIKLLLLLLPLPLLPLLLLYYIFTTYWILKLLTLHFNHLISAIGSTSIW